MHYQLALIAAAASVSRAYELSFYLGASCTGEELCAARYKGASGCITLPGCTTNTQSIVISTTDPSDEYYEVDLYGSDDCSGDTVGSVVNRDVCFPDEDRVVKSYAINAMAVSRKRRAPTPVKRSPQMIENEIDRFVRRNEMALEVRGESAATYELAAPKQYDVSMVNSSRYHTDLDSYHTYISASVIAVTGALSFSSLVTGCVGVGSAGPIASYSCAASLASTAISFIATAYNTYRGYRDFRAWLRRNNIELGVRPMAKRGEIGGVEGSMTMTHEEYMEYFLHLAGVNGTYIGHQQRDPSIDIRTPVYQFTGHDDNQYLYTIWQDDNGEVKHSFAFAHDGKIEKRQGYEGVTVNGGLDVDACQRKAGRQSDLPTNPKNAYKYYYQDFTCLVDSSDLLNGNYVQSDVMDTSGYAVLTIGICPYRGNQADHVEDQPVCSNKNFYFDQTCIY